jgi:ribonucleoside-diphosphate reductase beta chain
MIFDEQIFRKPNKYPWTKEFIDSSHESFWTVNEFSFQSDIQDFKVSLNDQERDIIIKTLSAVGQIEIAVKTFWIKLGENLPHPSLVDLGITLGHVEVIHNEAYERLISVLGLESIFEENLKLDVILHRVTYLRKYLHKYYKDSKKQYLYSLILFTLFIENVSLFSQFYIINWFNRFKNVLKDTGQQTLYTRNEENLHALAGIKIINTIRQEYPELFDEDLENKILKEAKEAFESESKIIDWMLGDFQGDNISSSISKEFVKNRINDSLSQIGFKQIFDIDSELIEKTTWFNEEVHGNNMTDFFHQRPVEYSKSHTSFNAEELF